MREEHAGNGVLYIPRGSVAGRWGTTVDVRGSQPLVSDVQLDFSFLFQDAHQPKLGRVVIVRRPPDGHTENHVGKACVVVKAIPRKKDVQTIYQRA